MRLIDGDEFEKRMNKYAKDCRDEGDTNTAQVFDDVACELQDAPIIDAVEIVRCKDCIYAVKIAKTSNDISCGSMRDFVKENDFCSKGERKDKE